MDKKGYIQSANGKDIRMGNCKCCNKKGTNKISIGTWDATEKNSFKEDGTVQMSDSFTLYLCDDCKKALSSVLTSSSKPITTQMIERIEGVKVESVFDIFDVDKMVLVQK